jgi:hypothetical protein
MTDLREFMACVDSLYARCDVCFCLVAHHDQEEHDRWHIDRYDDLEPALRPITELELPDPNRKATP